MVIEKGAAEDIDGLVDMYGRVCDALNHGTNYPGWEKDIYPDRRTAVSGLADGGLFVARLDGAMAGSFILRHEPEPGYALADWGAELDYRDIFVVYTLCVAPEYKDRGLGRELMEFILEYSAAQGMKAVRLDVYDKNVPAISLYRKCGFQYIDTVDLGYGEYGLDAFELYQKLL